jgi:nuclear transport factor 2 (NTF2) superfamily protein
MRQMYAAFNARDIGAVLAAMTTDVAWPNGWEGGAVHGHAAVRDYWTRQWAAIDPSVTPEGFEDDDDGRLRVRVRQVIRDLAGQVLSDQTVFHVYAFDGDLVRSMEILPAEA